MSEMLPNLKQQLNKELERAKFLAFSDIEATEKQLHGNSNMVVNKREAEAIFNCLLEGLAEKLQKLVNHDIKDDIEANPKDFGWLGKSQRRWIDFADGYFFAMTKVKEVVECLKPQK